MRYDEGKKANFARGVRLGRNVGGMRYLFFRRIGVFGAEQYRDGRADGACHADTYFMGAHSRGHMFHRIEHTRADTRFYIRGEEMHV